MSEKELKQRLDELNAILTELEEIYGDYFPEPSEQLDTWNRYNDEYWDVLMMLEGVGDE